MRSGWLLLLAVVGCVGDDGPSCPIDEVIDAVLVDLNRDGMSDEMDYTYFMGLTDGTGAMVPDDYDEDGIPDNRYFFDDRARCVPDADSFDDFEDPDLNIPRGVVPVSTRCEGDGIATGPLELGFADYRPSKYCERR